MSRIFFAVIFIGGLVLSSVSFGYSGGSGTPQAPYQIATKADLLLLAATSEDYNKCFILTADIDLEGQLFTAGIIGVLAGTFDGNNHKIANFNIDSTNCQRVGLFVNSGGSVKNLGIEDYTISGSYGGSASFGLGGLVGVNYTQGSIINCFSTGTINAEKWGNSRYIGGLVGYNSGIIANSYSTGLVSISGSSYVGGLVGYNFPGSISNCYATGSVSSYSYVGGLVGENDSGGSINNSYSTGAVSGTGHIGGLAGRSFSSDFINCYSTGTVSGSSGVGGLLGSKSGGSISACYFLDTSGPINGYGTPLTDEQMKQQANFIGWDFVGETTNGTENIWRMCIDGLNYPLLWWQFNIADFTCPDGVNMEDLDYFVHRWLLDDCASLNNCDRVDMNASGAVDFTDFAIFAQYWLQYE